MARLIKTIIPTAPRSENRESMQFFSAVKRALDELTTSVGISADGFVTRNTSGAAGFDGTGIANTVASFAIENDPVPLAPVSVTANGAISTVLVVWAYSSTNYPLFEVWRSDTSGALGSAVLAGTSGGTNFLDEIGAGETKYYWVRGVNRAGVPGPYSSGSGAEGTTSANPVTELASVQSGILESSLSASLISDLGVLAGVPAEISARESAVAAETLARATEIAAETSARIAADSAETSARSVAINSITSSVATVASDLAAETTNRTTQVSALTASIAAVDSTVTTTASDLAAETSARTTQIAQVEANYAAADVVVQTSVDTLTGEVNSIYEVKLDSNGNVAGFGLYNNATASTFAVRADRFAIINDNGNTASVPFSVSNGITYINTAMIADTSISSAQIATLTADKITAGTIDASVVTITNLSVDVANVSGNVSDINDAWFIDGTNAGFENIYLGGTIYNSGNIFGGNIVAANLYLDKRLVVRREGATGTGATPIVSDWAFAKMLPSHTYGTTSVLTTSGTNTVSTTVRGQYNFGIRPYNATTATHNRLVTENNGPLKVVITERWTQGNSNTNTHWDNAAYHRRQVQLIYANAAKIDTGLAADGITPQYFGGGQFGQDTQSFNCPSDVTISFSCKGASGTVRSQIISPSNPTGLITTWIFSGSSIPITGNYTPYVKVFSWNYYVGGSAANAAVRTVDVTYDLTVQDPMTYAPTEMTDP